MLGAICTGVISVAAFAGAEDRVLFETPDGVHATARECRPQDRMPIIRCIPDEAERVRATPGWRIDPDIVAWVR
jgi:hypothetical protein